jgi:hypothetical protein
MTKEDEEEEVTTEPKQPYAPKNKQQMNNSKKFTFDGFTPGNSLVESRDEDHGFVSPKEDMSEQMESTRDDNLEEKQADHTDNNVMTKDGEPSMTIMLKENIEASKEDSHDLANFTLQQIAGHGPFQTVPFDEDPEMEPVEDTAILMMIHNPPPPAAKPIPTPATSQDDAAEPEDTLMTGGQETVLPPQKDKNKDVESSTVVAVVTPPILSAKTAAVMSMPHDAYFQLSLESAPSDEMLDKSCLDPTPGPASSNDPMSDMEDDTMEATDSSSRDLVEMLREKLEQSDKRKKAVSFVVEPTTSLEEGPGDSSHKDVESTPVTTTSTTTNPYHDDHRTHHYVPSVVLQQESDEPMEQATATATMGDLKNQLEHLRVSEALEAVSNTFHEQTNLCGTPLSAGYWFGSSSTNSIIRNDDQSEADEEEEGEEEAGNDPDGSYRP